MLRTPPGIVYIGDLPKSMSEEEIKQAWLDHSKIEGMTD
jgi:hypothetical protein